MKPTLNIYDASQTRDLSKLAPAKGSTMSIDIEMNEMQILRGDHDSEFQAEWSRIFGEVAAMGLSAGKRADVAIYKLWQAARATPAAAEGQLRLASEAIARAKKLPVWDGLPHALHVELDALFKAVDGAAPLPRQAAVRNLTPWTDEERERFRASMKEGT